MKIPRRLLTTLFFVGVVFGLASGANAQYLRIQTDNPTDATPLRATANRAPTWAQPANMTVAEGATANQG